MSTVDALNMVLVAALVFLLMRQVIASLKDPVEIITYVAPATHLYPLLYPLWRLHAYLAPSLGDGLP
jgi:hypothetical protein